jgi:hypothetical protein
MSGDDLVVVNTFTSHVEADLACSALEAMGIAAMVRADDAGGEYPGLGFSHGVQILVKERDAELAKMVISVSASGT